MNMQSYYRTSLERDANICDMTKPLCVNCAGVVETDREFFTRGVRKDYYLMYVCGGEMDIAAGGGKYRLKEGSALIIPPKTEYGYGCVRGQYIHYLFLHFTGFDAAALLERLGLKCGAPENTGKSPGLTGIWERIYREFIYNDECFDTAAAAVLTEILVNISRSLKNAGGMPRFTKSAEYIHSHYDADIKISDLAAMENLSEPHFRACFKRQTGCSPGEYITNRRINAAALLLETTDKTLSEIAALAGYRDAYYFGRIFKKKTGFPPGRYRKLNFSKKSS